MTSRTAFLCAVVLAANCLSGPVHAQNSQTGIGFPSPQAALRSLRARAGVAFSDSDRWIVATDKANQTVWLFAREGDPAYPTAVKRVPTQTSKGWVLGSQIMCGGTQAACDAVAAAFAK